MELGPLRPLVLGVKGVPKSGHEVEQGGRLCSLPASTITTIRITTMAIITRSNSKSKIKRNNTVSVSNKAVPVIVIEILLHRK